MAIEGNGVPRPGNRRRGRTRGYGGQKGGAHQIAWRDDKIILDRIRVGLSFWLEQRTDKECLAAVNEYLTTTYPDEQPIALATLYADRRRGMELRREHAVDAADQHMAEYDHALKHSWRSYREAAPNAKTKADFMGHIINTIEKKAKLDRSLAPETQLSVVVQQQVGKLREVLEAALWDPEWGLTEDQRRLGIRVIVKHLRGEGSAPILIEG